ncbi:hypothetical protein TWF694_011308 [Orbilia ellipsospora]|uniref:TPR and ankyrin repeat-containing protein 1 n=1 Tax=Orbilia ellipsospora TaxID=2528407 RepID=A0AAV9X602_9PEZI
MQFTHEEQFMADSALDDATPEIDEEEDMNGLLDLERHKWPLICTFDTFAAMLQRSLQFAQRNIFLAHQDPSDLDNQNRRVDYGKFNRSYWPSFNTLTKKDLSADCVFSEIMGVIKATSTSHLSRPLSEDEYQALSHRVAPNFRAGPERHTIYNIYKAYEKRKSSLCEWDDLDRTAKIRSLLAQDGKLSLLLRGQITEVFVDEVQDQRLPEIELLLDLVKDVNCFAFAGDTAQCISRDSCFRFQDLKNLFYQKYEKLGNVTGEKDLAKLNLFTLSKNYRTHNGILKLAAKVVDIIYAAFPYVIDKLAPELGDFDGPAPIIFSGFSSQVLTYRKEGTTTVVSEFGADQVLIVRDEESRLSLTKELGEDVLILTILESKGMEFQDVFIYNFFTGSPCQVGFRALANSQVNGTLFDNTKYAELCVELKNLYVAITRSRGMLYIIENDTAPVKAISDMWGMLAKDPIIDIVLPDDLTLKTRLDEIKHGQSTLSEWAQKGQEFFDQRLYEQASYCYRKAGKHQLQDLCQAFLKERQGWDIISDPAQQIEAQSRYLEAARLFEKCERWDRALRCYESIKEFLLAANLCERLSKTSEASFKAYGRRAADLFMKANEIPRAISIYKKIPDHESVISAYRKINDKKELIHYLTE